MYKKSKMNIKKLNKIILKIENKNNHKIFLRIKIFQKKKVQIILVIKLININNILNSHFN